MQPPATGLRSQIAAFDYVFWLCIFMELMERMAYYGVRLVVPVFMVLAPSEGGPGLTHVEKGTVLALWAAMQSWLPTFAGGFSDRFGYKRTIAVSVFLKAGGYFLMSQADGFGSMVAGTQMLAAGTGLFKPGIQGTMAHSIAKAPGAASMGWGLFYQSVNVGAAIAAYIPAFTREKWGWEGVFATCSALVLVNLVPLFFYEDPVDERAAAKDTRSVGTLVRESVVDLFTSPVLMGFILLQAGFWFSFHQLFDMLPNYVDDWTDSSVLLRDAGAALGVASWAEAGAKGEMIPQERLININAILIMFTMFLFAWLSGKVRVLTSTIVGMAIATAAFGVFVVTANVYAVLAGVALFTIGEMLSSPKRQEFLSSLAPPGKRALFLGYANMPDGIGWVLGSLVAGSAYEEHGDKVNLARDHLSRLSDPAAVEAARVWVTRTKALAEQGATDKTLKEVAENMETTALPDALAKAAQLPDAELVRVVADALPRGEVLAHLGQAVPTLADPAAARAFLYATYEPGQVWYAFIAMGTFSVVGMLVYDRWLRKRQEARAAA
ncbi:MAG: MFS transporter [Myxococcota bacterium]